MISSPRPSSHSAPMTIRALSEAIFKTSGDAKLFANDQPENLADLVQRMEQQGYTVSAPVKAPNAPRRPGRVAWQITVTIPLEKPHRDIVGSLVLYVAEDVS